MEKFSEKSLEELGQYYVYGLIDPRNNKIFYIGKGKDNRVFEHERESILHPDNVKMKLKTISEIKALGLNVIKIIINYNLTEPEAFAVEASLINILNYISDEKLSNIISGHHSTGVLTVEEFERIHGAIELQENDIKHKILVIKINKLYRKDMPKDVLYDAVRGVWRASMKKVQNVDYVFGVYNSLIVAVYKPTHWYICKDAKDRLPRQDVILTPKTENRLFFIDENFENNIEMDDNAKYYLYKSISKLKVNSNTQNPISYLNY